MSYMIHGSHARLLSIDFILQLLSAFVKCTEHLCTCFVFLSNDRRLLWLVDSKFVLGLSYLMVQV
jgi:hypothetical protein